MRKSHNICWDVEEMGQVGVFIREIPVSSVNQRKNKPEHNVKTLNLANVKTDHSMVL